jgi:hypothetical protein
MSKNTENTTKDATNTVSTAKTTVKPVAKTTTKPAAKEAVKDETPVNPNEKTFRVVFKKNNGQGKRTRVVIKVETTEALIEAIEVKAKADRMRAMRVQEMKGTKVVSKFRIKLVDGSMELLDAKAVKATKPVAKPAVKATEKPAVKTVAKPAVKAPTKTVAKPAVKAVAPAKKVVNRDPVKPAVPAKKVVNRDPVKPVAKEIEAGLEFEV